MTLALPKRMVATGFARLKRLNHAPSLLKVTDLVGIIEIMKLGKKCNLLICCFF